MLGLRALILLLATLVPAVATGQTILLMAEEKGCDLPDLSLEEMQSVHLEIKPEVYSVLGVDNSVESRASYGGTAPSQVTRQIARWRKAEAE